MQSFSCVQILLLLPIVHVGNVNLSILVPAGIGQYGYLIAVKEDMCIKLSAGFSPERGRAYAKRGPGLRIRFGKPLLSHSQTMRPHFIQTHPVVIASPLYREPLFSYRNLNIFSDRQSNNMLCPWNVRRMHTLFAKDKMTTIIFNNATQRIKFFKSKLSIRKI